jgi:hypothetical protein
MTGAHGIFFFYSRTAQVPSFFFHNQSFSFFLSDLACTLQLGKSIVSALFIKKVKKKNEIENYVPITLICNVSKAF